MHHDQLYRQLVELAPDVVYSVDADSQTIISLNSAFETITGWQVDEWVGRPFPDILHPDDTGLAVLMFEEVLRGYITHPHLFRVRTKAGAYLTGEFRSVPLHDRDRVVGVFGIARDVTDRLRTSERQHFLSGVSEILTASLDYDTTLSELAASAVPFLADWCIVYRLEPDGQITRAALAHSDPAAAPVAERLRTETMIDSSAASGVPAVIRSGESVLSRHVDSGVLAGDVNEPNCLSTIVTEISITSWMCVPLTARGQVLGAITLLTAESGRRYDDDDLAFAEEFAHRAALAVDNSRLYAAAETAIRDREAFLSIASHELKTPLTTVKGLTQMLEMYLHRKDIPDDRMRTLVHHLSTQIARFETLIEDILDVARVRQGRLELRPKWIDLIALTQQVIDRTMATIDSPQRHTIELAAPAQVIGYWDPDRLDQVLVNLISNAVKYSPEGGTVAITIRLIEGHIELIVQDEGIGIPKSELQNLFQPFGRSETVRRSIGGVGLGLFISRQIVERHGGTIEVESDTGVGSTFTVRLPIEKLSRTSEPDFPVIRNGGSR